MVLTWKLILLTALIIDRKSAFVCWSWKVRLVAGMIWAVAPDIPRFFGFDELYHRLYRDPRCDLFFWHYTIDRIESDSMVYSVAFVLMLTSMLLVAIKELRTLELGR